MIISTVYFILAAFGLGILICIHELGHYYMARKVGMTVEVFSIGFGKPIVSWSRNGVQWQLCWVPFGGYVRIAGMEKEGDKEPSEIADGFFGKKPIDRIKVALAGPLTNLIFAFVVFSVIWALGGRDKPFNEFTKRIGWIDAQSELYAHGVRPGDEVVAYNGHSYGSNKDHLYAAMLSKDGVTVDGVFVDDISGAHEDFSYVVHKYQHPETLSKGIMTVGVLAPAQQLIFDEKSVGSENAFLPGSPMKESGIQDGDRIVGVDGILVYSAQQLAAILNDGKTLLTVERAGQRFLFRIPRFLISEYALSHNERGEIDDWHHASHTATAISESFFIPYNVTAHCVVESPLVFVDGDMNEKAFSEQMLESGDRIVAVDGVVVDRSYELFGALQERLVHIIVERSPAMLDTVSWKDADEEFGRSFDGAAITALMQSIASDHLMKSSGNFYLLNPVAPKRRSEFYRNEEERALVASEIEARKSAIDDIADAGKRERARDLLDSYESQRILGITALRDKVVVYNPSPFVLFGGIVDETYRTLRALVTGYINPKWLGGPIGIVQIMHYGWTLGIREALFWLAFVSLNLGIINLLPVPALDGGYVVISLVEMVTKRSIKAKTLERIIFPFIVLLVSFFIYLSYQDIYRIISRFFQ